MKGNLRKLLCNVRILCSCDGAKIPKTHMFTLPRRPMKLSIVYFMSLSDNKERGKSCYVLSDVMTEFN